MLERVRNLVTDSLLVTRLEVSRERDAESRNTKSVFGRLFPYVSSSSLELSKSKRPYQLDAIVLEERILYSASPLLALGDFGASDSQVIDQIDELIFSASATSMALTDASSTELESLDTSAASAAFADVTTDADGQPQLDLNGVDEPAVVSSNGKGDQLAPETITLSGGNYVIAWMQESDYYASVFDSSGKLISSDMLLDDTDNSMGLTLTDIGSGGFAAVWSSEGELHVRRFDEYGTVVDKVSVAFPFKDGLERSDASLVETVNGEFVVAYRVGNLSEKLGSDVAFFVLNSELSLVRDEVIVSDEASGNQLSPQVVALSNGGFAIAFTDRNGRDGDSSGVYLQLYDSAGKGISENYQVSDNASGMQEIESITRLGKSHFLVTWSDSQSDGSELGVFGRVFSSESGKSGNVFSINQSTAGIQVESHAVDLRDGSFAVVWNSLGANGDGDIFIRRFDQDGNALSDEMLVNTTPMGGQSHPVVTYLWGTRVSVTWQDDTADGDGQGIITRHFDFAPWSVAYHENGKPIEIHPLLSIVDFDNKNLEGATIRITANFVSDEDQLYFIDQNGITGSWDSDSGTLTLSGTASVEDYEVALRSIAYANGSESPSTDTRVVSWTVSGSKFSSFTRESHIQVVSVNDAPYDLRTGGLTIAENAVNATAVGMVTGSDFDSGDTLKYALVDSASGRFAIHATTGAITVANGSLLNFEVAISHSVKVRTTDSAGATYEKTFIVSLSDVNEFAVSAILDSAKDANLVQENASKGTLVGYVAKAMDLDATTNKITYSLDDDANGRFTIDSATGVVSVGEGAVLDYELHSHHAIVVRATSEDRTTIVQAVEIEVGNMNEAPIGTADSYETTFIESLVISIPGVLDNDSDPEGDKLAVELVSGPSVGDLFLHGDGSFVYDPEPNFVGTVNLTYRVTDGAMVSEEIVISIAVLLPNSLPGDGPTERESEHSKKENDTKELTIESSESIVVEKSDESSPSSKTSELAPAAEASPNPSSNPSDDVVHGATQEPPIVDQVPHDDRDEERASQIGVKEDVGFEGVQRAHEFPIHTSTSQTSRDDLGRRYRSNQEEQNRRGELASEKIELQSTAESYGVSTEVIQVVVGTGIVIWAIQGAQLLATLVASTPVWIQLDPVSVLPKASVDELIPDDELTEGEKLFEDIPT